MIAVENLQKGFGETKALDGVSFEVAPGMTIGHTDRIDAPIP